MSDAELLQKLAAIVGADNIDTDDQALDDYSRDAVGWARISPNAGTPTLPDLVVRPTSTQEVVDIVKLAKRTKTPLIPYGSGTGVMGAATSLNPGIVLDMGHMSAILRVSAEDRTATVQPGVVLGDLDKALNEFDLFLGHDPWSQPIASVGGAISTNGLGYLGSGYGGMGDQVLGMEFVTPNGDVIRTKPVPKASTGADFKHLLIGGEGVFGVMTEITLRAHPVPEDRRVYAIRFPSFPFGFAAVCEMFSIGLIPAMVDMGEEGEPHIASEGDFPTTLYMTLDGFREMTEAKETRALQIVQQHHGDHLGPTEAKNFWNTRHRSAERYLESRAKGQRHPWASDRPANGFFDYIHTALPISRVLEFRQEALRIYEEHNVEVHECAIWGPPELFSILARDETAETDADMERGRAASDAALMLAQDMGGNMEHVHGIGLRLIHLMERELGKGGMATAKRIKRALDPAGIMSPGKLYR